MATDTRSYPVRDVMARAGLAVYTTGWLWAFDLGHRCRRELARLVLDRQFAAAAGEPAFPLAISGLVVACASFWSCVVQRVRNRKTPAEIAVLLEQNYGMTTMC